VFNRLYTTPVEKKKASKNNIKNGRALKYKSKNIALHQKRSVSRKALNKQKKKKIGR
jgi:hypothetical protein